MPWEVPEDLVQGQRPADLLRFLTCGSVDDGKSTLIGRLLYETSQIPDDQMTALVADSRHCGTTGDAADLALLVDGLQAEREQGITIDVAYRFFTTRHRRLIVADTPGHEQYTRNMATGASTADLAVILVDARKGIVTQTRRHAFIVAVMGIRHIVLAVNKMDLASWSEARFCDIAGAFEAFATDIGIAKVTAIPLSALTGDNVARESAAMPWFTGPTLVGCLDTTEIPRSSATTEFRFPVQWVNRPHAGFRGYTGTVRGGSVRVGAAVTVLPSGRRSTVERIVTYDGDLQEAVTGDAVTLTLADEIDVVRGDVIADAEKPPSVADQLAARVIWMHHEAMLPGRRYLMRVGTAEAVATITELRYRIDIGTMAHEAAKTLELNEIGLCNLSLDRPIVFDPYEENRDTGGFILIDRATNATVGAGMIRFALRRATNIAWQPMTIDRAARAAIKGQQPCVIWFTGLSGAGKSTIADRVEQRLNAMGRHTYVLDGDNVRHGLNRDLGFTAADRVENIRRVAEVARLFTDAGLIVLVSFISPFRSERQMARELMGEGEFFEIFVDAPLDLCERRDPKGLYRKARAGELPNFTGIDSPYEPPEQPDLVIPTATIDPDEAAERVMALLARHGRLG